MKELPRGLKSAFSLQQKSPAANYHSLPITSILRAIVDDLRCTGKPGMLHVYCDTHSMEDRRLS